MFEVKGIPLLVDDIDVLKELKNQLYIKQGKERFRKIKPSGDNIMVCCPIHNNGQERNPSCGIATRRVKGKPPGTVHCFACGYTDSLEGMISKCFGYDDNGVYGTNWLLENFAMMETYDRPSLIGNLSREPVKEVKQYVTEEELASYRYYHPYMFQRKLTNEIIEKYDVGYQKDYIHAENWQPMEVLTFPVKDKNGNCLFVSRRAIYNKTFFLPPDLIKPVYGIYELPKNAPEIIVCESVFNALTCVAYGKPAVALFGTGDPHQLDILSKLPARKIIIGFDPDEAGAKGTKRAAHYLAKHKLLSRLILPQGKDINDLSYTEFINLKNESVQDLIF